MSIYSTYNTYVCIYTYGTTIDNLTLSLSLYIYIIIIIIIFIYCCYYRYHCLIYIYIQYRMDDFICSLCRIRSLI